MSTVAAVLHRDGSPVGSDETGPLLALMARRGGLGTGAHDQPGVWMAEQTDPVRSTSRRFDCPRHADVVVVADAHLTERRTLAQRLRSDGVDLPAAPSDRELITSAWARWGRTMVEHLRGEFAVLVWDGPQGQLVGVTDQLGARELFWADVGDVVVVASSPLAVLAHPRVPRDLDESAMGNYLLIGNPRRAASEATSFSAMRRLLPAHDLVVGRDSVVRRRYWDFPFDEPMLELGGRRDYLDAFTQLLEGAVEDRLDDVPRAAVHLSGGLDSTSIAAVAMRLQRAGRVQTRLSGLSVVYDRLAPDTEAYYAGLAAREIGLEVDYLAGDGYPLVRPLSMRAEPMQDFGTGLTEEIHRRTAEKGPLVLSGKGGDELLTNTPLYKSLLGLRPLEAARLYRWLTRMSGSRPPLGGRRAYVQALVTGRRQVASVPTIPVPDWLDPDFVARAGLLDQWEALWQPPTMHHPTQPDVARFMGRAYWNVRDELLDPQGPQSDITMPLADLRLMHFVFSLPPAPWNKRKALLRESMVGSLPAEVLQRPKTGAPVYQRHLLQDPAVGWVDDWPGTATLGRYVRRDLVPPLHYAATTRRAIGDSLPLFLDTWLSAQGFE